MAKNIDIAFVVLSAIACIISIVAVATPVVVMKFPGSTSTITLFEQRVVTEGRDPHTVKVPDMPCKPTRQHLQAASALGITAIFVDAVLVAFAVLYAIGKRVVPSLVLLATGALASILCLVAFSLEASMYLSPFKDVRGCGGRPMREMDDATLSASFAFFVIGSVVNAVLGGAMWYFNRSKASDAKHLI